MADMKNQVKSSIDLAAERAKNATDRVADGASDAKQEGQGLVDRVKGNANYVAEKAGEYAGQARDKMSNWSGEAGQMAREAGDKVQKWAGDAYEVTTDKLGDFGKEVTSLIRKHPLPSILIGLGIGVLLGRTSRMI